MIEISEIHRTIEHRAMGKYKGNLHYIQRNLLTLTDLGIPIDLKRIQFPRRSAFAMTVNKSQGCTFNYVGIYLNDPLFSHGQLFVAMSKVSSLNNLFIATSAKVEGTTRNLVYKEIFKS